MLVSLSLGRTTPHFSSWKVRLKDMEEHPFIGYMMESLMTAPAASSLSSVTDSDTLCSSGRKFPGSPKQHTRIRLIATMPTMQIIVFGKPNWLK